MDEKRQVRNELWEILNTASLVVAMLGGAALASLSLLYWPSIAEYSAAKIIGGAIAGAIGWKVGKRLLRRQR